MEDEVLKEAWDRLQREYQNAVQVSYPNPERNGCPGTDVLGDLARRSVQFEDIEQDEPWRHVIHCGPCYDEYLNLREGCRMGSEATIQRESR